MGFDQKTRFAIVAFAVASVVLAGLGLHAGHAIHVKALEFAGGWD